MLSGICTPCLFKTWTTLCEGTERPLCSAVLTHCTWDLCPWGWGLHVSSSPSRSYAVGEPVVSPIFDLVSWTNLGSMLKVACLHYCPWPRLLGWTLELCCSLISGPIAFCCWPDSLHGPGSWPHLLWDCWRELLPLVLAWAVLLAAVPRLLPCCSQPCLALPAWLPALTPGLPRHCRLGWLSLVCGWPRLLHLSCWTDPAPCPCLLPRLLLVPMPLGEARCSLPRVKAIKANNIPLYMSGNIIYFNLLSKSSSALIDHSEAYRNQHKSFLSPQQALHQQWIQSQPASNDPVLF